MQNLIRVVIVVGTPIRNSNNESKGRGAGPVKEYTLSPEELAKIVGQPIPRSHLKPIDLSQGTRSKEGNAMVADGKIKEGPACGLTKVEFIKAVAGGETLSSIERAWNMKYNTIHFWIKKWNLKGITPDKALDLLETMPSKEASEEPLEADPSAAAPKAPINAAPSVNEEVEQLQTEIERLKDEIQDWTENDLKRAEEIQYLKAEIERLNGQLQDLATANERLGEERDKLRLKVDSKPKVAISEKQPTPQAFVSIALPLIDTGHDIEERLESLQLVGQLKDKLDIRGINTRRLMDETLELLQVIAGIIQARAADVVRPSEVPATVQAFFSDHNAQHMQRMEKLAAEQGWTLVRQLQLSI